MIDKKNPSYNLGFTLLELLIVIVIIGILVSFISLSVFQGLVRARDAQRKSDIKQIQAALQVYFQDHNEYPPSQSCNSGDAACWKTFIGDPYIKKMPTDPLNNDTYLYYYCINTTDNSKYTLVANLENAKDSQRTTDPKDCSSWVGGSNLYIKTNP